MHWLAIAFLVIKALTDIVGNLGNLIDGEYNSFLDYLCGSAVNAFAWVYVLNYVLSGVR